MNNHRNVFDVVTGKNGQQIKTIMVNMATYQELWKTIQEFMAADPTYDFREQEKAINPLIFWSIMVNNIIGMRGYSNVLLVNSFRNTNFPELYDNANGRIHYNIVNNIWPIISDYFEVDVNVHVAYPSTHQSFARNIVRHFDVQRITCNKPYVMGDDTYSVDPIPDEKFDAVFLAGIPITEGEEFNAADIKADFASMCTEDFDLIDSFHGQRDTNGHDTEYAIAFNKDLPVTPNRLVGETQDISELAEYINNNMTNLTTSDLANGAEKLRYILPHLGTVIRNEFKVY